MKNISILIVVIVILLVSCSDESEVSTTVKGKVINWVTKQPIPNAIIKIERHSNGTISGSGDEVVHTFKTDLKGEFDETLLLPNNKWYTIEYDYWNNVGSSLNDGIYELNDREAIGEGEVNEIEFRIAPVGGYVLNLLNKNCFNENDSLYVQETLEFSEYNDNMGTFSHVGCNRDNGVQIAIPMGNIYLNWTVTKNGVTTEQSDSIYLPAGEVKEYTIEY